MVLDLETTGLDPDANVIIEMGAIRVNRGTGSMESLSLLVRPRQPIPAHAENPTQHHKDQGKGPY